LRKFNRCTSDPSEPTPTRHIRTGPPGTSDTCVYAQETIKAGYQIQFFFFFSIRRVSCGIDPWALLCSRSPARPTARARVRKRPPCPPEGGFSKNFPGKGQGRARWQSLSGLVSLGPCPSAADGVEREGRERRILWGGRLLLVPAAGRGRGWESASLEKGT
jgi:hypothetical protein